MAGIQHVTKLQRCQRQKLWSFLLHHFTFSHAGCRGDHHSSKQMANDQVARGSHVWFVCGIHHLDTVVTIEHFWMSFRLMIFSQQVKINYHG